jgi:hypothetical protein
MTGGGEEVRYANFTNRIECYTNRKDARCGWGKLYNTSTQKVEAGA